MLEIVELANGEIVLQRADGKGEPLINIKFSDESKAYMPDVQVEIAKAMIHAGVQAFSEITSNQGQGTAVDQDELDGQTLH